MDKLVLDIPKLQDTVNQTNQMITETKEIGKSTSETNRKLTASGTWQGDGANAYKGKAEQWNKNFKTHENTVTKMRDAMKTVLGQAEALNKQALGFAGIVGGSSSNGTRNMLTYDPSAKAGVMDSCDKAINQIDSQLDQVRRAGSALSGITGLRLLSDLSTYRRALNDQKNKLSRLKQAITRYATSAEALATTATRVFGGINMPEGAIATLKSWDISHEEIADMLKGLNLGCNIFGGDPVNMATGNFVYEKEYLKIKGLFPLSFKMFYNAQEKRTGAIGPGWVHNFGASLIKGKQIVTLHLEDGREETFYENADGTYTQNYNKHDKLRKTGKGFLYQNTKNISYRFDKDGKNIKISDPNGNSASLFYEQDLLIRVGNNSGGVLAYDYSPEGNLIQVSDNTGRTVKLSYEDGKVCSVTGEEGQEQKYHYNDKGKISDITNPLGIQMLSNEYDIENRISKQTFPDGGVIQYVYRDEEKELHVTEQNGNEIVYVHDDRMRSTASIYEDGEERYAYNEQNQRTWKIDKNGNETRYDYDERGNISQVTNALGETVCAEYDKHNKPTKITNAAGGTTTNKYDNNGNLTETENPLGNAVKFTIDERGLITEITLPDGSVSVVCYDELGNILSFSDPAGNAALYEYDSLNRVIKTTDPEGYETKFEYNAKGDITRVTNAEGNTQVYEYNASGKLTKLTDFGGGITTYKYNTMSKLEQVISPSGGVTEFEYDKIWNVISATDPNGSTIRCVYDKLRRVIQTIDAEGNVTKYEHDPNDNVTAVVSPIGARAEIKYDALNRHKEITEPNGAVTRLEYNALGNVTKIIDPQGGEIWRTYDKDGHVVSITDQSGSMTKYTYTTLGQIETVVDALGGVYTYSYYPGGRLKSAIRPSGESESYEYDSNGNTTRITDALGNTNEIAYDCLNRIRTKTNPLGYKKTFGYDALGNITSVTDESWNVTQYNYSPIGELTEVIDAKGHSLKYDYDKSSRLTRMEIYRIIDETYADIKQIEMQVTTWERNRCGEIIKMSTPLGGVTHYKYDPLGNVIAKIDETGLETLYEYNLANKLAKVTYSDGKTVELTYNALRQLTELRDWLGTMSIEVDELGRAKRTTDHEGKTVGYEWDALGRRETIIYPDESKVDYSYNASGLLESVTSETGVTQYSYDQMGRVKERIMPGSIVTQYVADPIGRLESLTHQKNGEILDQLKYTYDPVGNITQIAKYRRGVEADNGKFNYAYDSLGRLTEATNSYSNKQYRYDSLGNRIMSVHDSVKTQHSYNARNQLIRTQEGDISKDYSYDARGNLTNILENGAVTASYAFDSANRMVEAITDRGKAVYEYNGFLKRVSKLETLQDSGAAEPDPLREIRYTLDLTRPYNDLLAIGGQRFVWGGEILMSEGENRFAYLTDHLGSPIRLMGEDQEEKQAYDEFGVPTVAVGSRFSNPFGFTGYQPDDISGYYYAQARWYRQELGRFASEDGVRDGLNWYAYCYSNPVRFSDPYGLVAVDAAAYAETYSGATVTSHVTYHESMGYGGIAVYHITIALGNDSFDVYADSAGRYIVDDSVFVNTFGVGTNGIVVHNDEATGNVSIRAAFNISGSGANSIIDGSTCFSLFLCGVESAWSGSIGTYEVATYARASSNGIKVNIHDKMGISNMRSGLFGWSPRRPGKINMYMGDSRGDGSQYSASAFMWVSAHEFGHTLGVGDMYTNSSYAGVSSIFNGYVGEWGVQERDIDKVLTAWDTGKWQRWK